MKFYSLLSFISFSSLTLCFGQGFGSQDVTFAHSLLKRLPTGTCDANTPCVNGACCGTSGLCGYSPTECGSGNCTSNCDAKAECGQYGKTGSQECPLGVCCSKFGFCGSTSDFCDEDKGCQSDFGGCGDVDRPSCGGSSANKRTVGYYESWSSTRDCQAVQPEDLNLNGFTHINFAFAFFDPTTFAIAPMDSHSGSLYDRFVGLKDNYAGLETWISVGGWSFTDPGATRTAFSDMASTAANRKRFIDELISFMDSYGFDGVDLDWEYPQADDRGGVTADKANYVSLVKELRNAFGTRYGITMTLPTSYWYLQHFDLENIQSSVDWFNFMAYDLHGTWDAQSEFVGPYIAPHTNVTEIDLGLDLLWRSGVKPANVVLGMGWYGRSFTLADAACNTPNGVCQFTGGADAGQCSGASGILTLREIKDIISDNDLTPTWDKTAEVKWITWNDNQWVSYDDDDTFEQKRSFANKRCLGGTMVWAMDQVDQDSDNGLAPAAGVSTDDQETAKQMSDDLVAGLSCYTTECAASCKKGTNLVTQMNGQPGKLSTSGRCAKDEYRSLCCTDGTTMGTCKWRGFRGQGLSCMGGCADGETQIVQDTNHHDKNGDQTCTGGTQTYCCDGFKSAPSLTDKEQAKETAKEEAEEKAKEAAEAAAEAMAEQAALDIAAKAFCRLAVPALLAPLEALEALIPIVGEILDLVEIAATPALIQLCTDGIEKEGKAVFKVFGKEHSIDNFSKPTVKKTTREPSKTTHTSASTKSTTCTYKNAKRMARACRIKDVTRTTSVTNVAPARTGAFNCNGNDYEQPCLNYQSISRVYPQFQVLTCRYKALDGNPVRTAPALWRGERNTVAWDTKMKAAFGSCDYDEFPPAYLADNNDGFNVLPNLHGARNPLAAVRPAYGRYVDEGDNRGAGQIFKGCAKIASRHDANPSESIDDSKSPQTRYIDVEAVFTRAHYTMNFDAMPNYADDGLGENECQPFVDGEDYRGYALQNNDVWFDQFSDSDREDMQDLWLHDPSSKHRRDWVKDVGLVVTESNITRPATRDETAREFGFDACQDEKCSREIRALKDLAEVVVREFRAPGPSASPAEPTPEALAGPFSEKNAFENMTPSRRRAEMAIPEPTGQSI